MTADARPVARRGWRELALIGVVYGAYSLTRNLFGSGSVPADEAYANARRILGWEAAIGTDVELAVQRAFLDHGWFLWAANMFYGTMHFLVPIAALLLLWRRRPDAYPLRRTALLLATGLGLIGFALFPLMPPRLLCDCPYGSGVDSGFVDTLAVHGGLWSFDSGTMQAVSNQYAAMPSLHFAWALWCALAVQVLLRRRWARATIFAYPLVTLFVIIVTGNHYWLDAVGGAVVVGVGWGLALVLHGPVRTRAMRPPSPPSRHRTDTVAGGPASSEHATAP